MLNYIFKRMLSAIPFMFMVSLTVFILIQLPPGDYVDSWAAAQAASGETIEPAKMESMRHDLGLDKPMIVQYYHWVAGMLQGDFGRSFAWNDEVKNLVGERIGLHPVAVIFALMAFGQLFGLIGVLLALPMAAVLYVGLRHLVVEYRRSRFYRDLPRRRPPADPPRDAV